MLLLYNILSALGPCWEMILVYLVLGLFTPQVSLRTTPSASPSGCCRIHPGRRSLSGSSLTATSSPRWGWLLTVSQNPSTPLSYKGGEILSWSSSRHTLVKDLQNFLQLLPNTWCTSAWTTEERFRSWRSISRRFTSCSTGVFIRWDEILGLFGSINSVCLVGFSRWSLWSIIHLTAGVG